MPVTTGPAVGPARSDSHLVNGDSQLSGGEGVPPPPDRCFLYVASLGQGWFPTPVGSRLSRWIGTNPVPGKTRNSRGPNSWAESRPNVFVVPGMFAPPSCRKHPDEASSLVL